MVIRHLTYLLLSFCMTSVVVSFISFILPDIGGGDKAFDSFIFHSFSPNTGGGDKAFDSFIFHLFLPNTGGGDKVFSSY